MKLSIYTALVAFLCMSALAYVWQEVNQVVLSYEIRGEAQELAGLIDERNRLAYNVQVLKGPADLERRLVAKDIALDTEAYTRVVKVAVPQAESVDTIQVARKGSGSTSFLARFREGAHAEASMIVPSQTP